MLLALDLHLTVMHNHMVDSAYVCQIPLCCYAVLLQKLMFVADQGSGDAVGEDVFVRPGCSCVV